jgi:hypothetical protein
MFRLFNWPSAGWKLTVAVDNRSVVLHHLRSAISSAKVKYVVQIYSPKSFLYNAVQSCSAAAHPAGHKPRLAESSQTNNSAEPYNTVHSLGRDVCCDHQQSGTELSDSRKLCVS